MILGTKGDNVVATLAIPLAVEEFRHASAWLADVARRHHAPEEALEKLDLCLNEALANVMSYGGPAAFAVPLALTFHCRKTGDTFMQADVSVTDSGNAFDPIASEAKQRPQSLASATPGGHGLVIIRAFADELSYEYVDQRNVLRFGVRWQLPT